MNEIPLSRMLENYFVELKKVLEFSLAGVNGCYISLINLPFAINNLQYCVFVLAILFPCLFIIKFHAP